MNRQTQTSDDDRDPRQSRATLSAISGSSGSCRCSPRRSCSTSCRWTTRGPTCCSRGRAGAHAILDGEDDRLLVVVGPCSVHDPEAGPRVRGAAQRRGQAAGRRPADRDARLLREAAHDDRLEGPDQRSSPRRLRRRQRRPAAGPSPAARGARPRHSGRLRVPRPDHAAVHLRPRLPGVRSARARPRARSIASSDPACRCRSASRTGPTATSRSRSTRSGRPRPDTPSPGSTPTAARRSCTPAATATATSSCAAAAARPTSTPSHVARRDRAAAGGRASRADDDRPLARQQRQGSRPPARGRRVRSPSRLRAATARSTA